MKKSTRATGNAYQRWCAKWIEENIPDCMVHNQTPMASFVPAAGRWVSKRNDILGCIDLVCIAPDRPPLFVQCTAHKSFTEKLKELEKVPWNLRYADVWVMLKREPGRTDVRKLDKENGKFFLVDIGSIVRGKWTP